MTAAIRAGAPPGQNCDAQGWRALGVLKMAGEHFFSGDYSSSIWSTSRARWAAFVGAFRPLRLVRRWVGVLS